LQHKIIRHTKPAHCTVHLNSRATLSKHTLNLTATIKKIAKHKTQKRVNQTSNNINNTTHPTLITTNTRPIQPPHIQNVTRQRDDTQRRHEIKNNHHNHKRQQRNHNNQIINIHQITNHKIHQLHQPNQPKIINVAQLAQQPHHKQQPKTQQPHHRTNPLRHHPHQRNNTNQPNSNTKHHNNQKNNKKIERTAHQNIKTIKIKLTHNNQQNNKHTTLNIGRPPKPLQLAKRTLLITKTPKIQIKKNSHNAQQHDLHPHIIQQLTAQPKTIPTQINIQYNNQTNNNHTLLHNPPSAHQNTALSKTHPIKKYHHGNTRTRQQNNHRNNPHQTNQTHNHATNTQHHTKTQHNTHQQQPQQPHLHQ